MKRGFTIVELLIVLMVIAVLMGLVTTAASQSMQASRRHKAKAICTLVEAGFANYYAQYDKWPGPIGDRIANGSLGTRANDEGTAGNSDTEDYVLTTAEADECVRAMIDETKKGNPVMDISGLFVTDAGMVDPNKERCNCKAKNHNLYNARNVFGLDFMEAIHGTKRSPKRMSTRSMHFGYPHPVSGKFMPFKVIYSIPTDAFTVKPWHWPGVFE